MRDGTRNHTVEQLGEAHQLEHHHEGQGSLDIGAIAALDMLERLQILTAAHTERVPSPAQARITLSRFAQAASPIGNPAEWTGWPALSIAVYNPNAFAIGVGSGGSGTGDVTRPGAILVGGNRLVVLPIADEVYSFGTAAANIAAADATVWAWRYATVLAPAVYAL